MTQVNVYAAVDVSSSMRGERIHQVCTSLKEIIRDCPAEVLFDITIFSATSLKVVTALKTGVDPEELESVIKNATKQGWGTALYDAWGDLVTSIPSSVLGKAEVHLLVLTDGEDNASKRYNLDSVTKLTQDLIRNNGIKFNFIQVGEGANVGVVQSLKKIGMAFASGSKRIQSQVVTGTASGIKTALSSVRSDILQSCQESDRVEASSSSTMLQSTNRMIIGAPSSAFPAGASKLGLGNNNVSSRVQGSSSSLLSGKNVSSSKSNATDLLSTRRRE